MPKARKPNAGRNPGFLPQQQKSPCPPERLIPTPDAPSFPVNKGGTALKTPFAEPTRQRAFFMSPKAFSNDSALNFRGHYPRAFPQSCPASWFPAGCGWGECLRAFKNGVFLTVSFSHSAPNMTQNSSPRATCAASSFSCLGSSDSAIRGGSRMGKGSGKK